MLIYCNSDFLFLQSFLPTTWQANKNLMQQTQPNDRIGIFWHFDSPVNTVFQLLNTLTNKL